MVEVLLHGGQQGGLWMLLLLDFDGDVAGVIRGVAQGTAFS